uniref:Uncharacterized protein n=1 Tax=Amphimedon queenslandica TaxID=400682 RepID=A0A1X7USF7_AMPQE
MDPLKNKSKEYDPELQKGTRPASAPVTITDSNKDQPMNVPDGELQSPGSPTPFHDTSTSSLPVQGSLTSGKSTNKSYKRKGRDTCDILMKLAKLEEDAAKRKESRENK